MQIRKISGPSRIDYRFEMNFATWFIASLSELSIHGIFSVLLKFIDNDNLQTG